MLFSEMEMEGVLVCVNLHVYKDYAYVVIFVKRNVYVTVV